MALTSEGDALTDQHRRQQAALSVDVIGHMRRLWPMLDPARLDATRGPWAAAVLDVIAQGYPVSAGIAAAYLPAYRVVEQAGGPLVLPPLRPVDLAAARSALELLGPIRVKQRLAGGMDRAEAMRIAEGQTTAAVQSTVANGGRNLLLDTVRVDRAAVGWARIASAGACAFCAMLCSRGPVYRSERTASFRPHPGCNCTVEVVYHATPDAWSPIARQYEDEWTAASIDADKTSGSRAALNAYRRHLYSQRTDGPANAKRAGQLTAEANRRRDLADAAPSSAAAARTANLAERAAAGARATTPAAREAVRAADEAAAAARAAAARLLARQEAAAARTAAKAEVAEEAAAAAVLDEAGVPMRLTYAYLEPLDDDQLDDLTAYLAERLDDASPAEGRRWDDLEVFLDVKARTDDVTAGEGALGLAETDRLVRELLDQYGRPGLTHPRVGGHSVTAGPSRAEVQEEFAVLVEGAYVDAEAATRGVMLNAAGRAAGIDPRSLLAGDVRRVLRYASEELLEHFETNRRMTWSEFYYARTKSPAFAEAAARAAAANARLDRDRTAGRR